MALTEETPRATERQAPNVGRIEEIQGVVIEAVFPDKLPEINHAITIARPEAAKREVEEELAVDPGGMLSSARSSSTSATIASEPSRWTRPTALRAAPR